MYFQILVLSVEPLLIFLMSKLLVYEQLSMLIVVALEF